MPGTIAASLATLIVLATPPSGRPPIGPLDRYDPKMYDIRFEVMLTTDPPRAFANPLMPGVPIINPNARQLQVDWGTTFDLADAPVVMPVIMQGTFSAVDRKTVTGSIWLDNVEDKSLASRARIDDDMAFHTSLVVMPIERFTGQLLRWNVRYRTQAWSSRLNDAQAARITWPRDWPEEVADGLRQQLYIESDDPIFAETVERISNGQLRMVTPFVAAKEVIRYCLANIKVSGDSMYYGRFNAFHGMVINGALASAGEGRGGPIDLVCVCVAMLRAAGIPARPVIGVEEVLRSGGKTRTMLVVWAEFYLPECGWIPFDPIEMRKQTIPNRKLMDPWPHFGTLKDLNERIPLSYHFMPPARVEAPNNPALWGWDPRPNGSPRAEQIITLGITSRGRGIDDPE